MACDSRAAAAADDDDDDNRDVSSDAAAAEEAAAIRIQAVARGRQTRRQLAADAIKRGGERDD